MSLVLKRAGMPSGSVRCVLKVPSLKLVRDLTVSFSDGTRKFRRVLHELIPASEEAREGATFTIEAQVRHRENQGYRWIVLCRWHAGESINRVVEEARRRWQQLNEEKRRVNSACRFDLSGMTVDRIKATCPALTDEEAMFAWEGLKGVRQAGIESLRFERLLLDVNDMRRDVSHRVVVCSMLHLLGVADAAVPIARALADGPDDPRLVWAAARALAALSTWSATPILIDVLEAGTPEKQAAAAWVLRGLYADDPAGE